MKLGELIKQYREKNNVSRAEFGRQVGCTREYIRQIEEGINCMVSLDKLELIANEINVPFKDIVNCSYSEQVFKNKTYYKIYVDTKQFNQLVK